MKVLLDENMPIALAELLVGHEVQHVDQLGLKSVRNGKLVALAREQFEVLVTLDKGILFQHDHRGQALRILVLRVPDARKATILARVAELLEALELLAPGEHRQV